MAESGCWDFWIHRGDAQTDVVARRPDGAVVASRVHVFQVPAGGDAALVGIAGLLDVPPDRPIPAERIGRVALCGFSPAALAAARLKTLLIVSKGFRHALELAGPGDGTAGWPLPLPVDQVAEVNERVLADGRVEAAPDLNWVRDVLEAAREDGIEAVAVHFMHAHRHPAHESAVAAVAGEIGFVSVVAGHRAAPHDGFLARGRAAVLDAALSIPVRGEAIRLARALGMPASVGGAADRLLVAGASGGLKVPDRLTGRDGLFAARAARIAAARTAAGRSLAAETAIDIAATDTVLSVSGEEDPALSAAAGGLEVAVAAPAHEVVALGGWSTVHRSGGRLAIGPETAPARTGPACFGRGGPACLFDAALVTGRLQIDLHPPVFGPAADAPLRADAAEAAFASLAEADGTPAVALADGALDLAARTLAARIGAARQNGGFEPPDALILAGDAAGLLACRIAEALGAGTVRLPGLGGPPPRPDAASIAYRGFGQPLEGVSAEAIGEALLSLSRTAVEDLAAAGFPAEAVVWRPVLHLSFGGLDPVLAVPFAALSREQGVARFEAQFRALTGFIPAGRPIILDAVSVTAHATPDAAGATDAHMAARAAPDDGPSPITVTRFFSGGRWRTAPLLLAEALRSGQRIQGPALIAGPLNTVVVESSWLAEVAADGALTLIRSDQRSAEETPPAADSVRRAVVLADVDGLVGELAGALRRTAMAGSVRMGRSTAAALVDADGTLLAAEPAEALPGLALAAAVRAVKRAHRDAIRPGDVFVHNAPYSGGTRVQDLAVVSPVFGPQDDRPRAFLASRAEYGDVGGLAPGSITPRATTIDEEGAVIDALLLVDGAAAGGGLREQALIHLLTASAFPARAAADTVHDLKAAVAAHRQAMRDLETLTARWEAEAVDWALGERLDATEEAMRRRIATLTDSSLSVDLGDGATILGAIEIDRDSRSVVVDFTGTSAQRRTHVNATETAAQAAVLAALLSAGDPLPFDGGALRPVEVILPEGSMLKPVWPAAVAAGLLRTAPALTDALLGAMKRARPDRFTTLALAGRRLTLLEAVPGRAGASTRHVPLAGPLADPERLEHHLPLVLEDWSTMTDEDGGPSAGTERRLRALDQMTLTVLTPPKRPAEAPIGDDEATGAFVRRLDGTVQAIDDDSETLVRASESIIVRTPATP